MTRLDEYKVLVREKFSGLAAWAIILWAVPLFWFLSSTGLGRWIVKPSKADQHYIDLAEAWEKKYYELLPQYKAYLSALRDENDQLRKQLEEAKTGSEE